jgi:GR25 family glycosyltransferase involved in LPS biosynthesis
MIILIILIILIFIIYNYELDTVINKNQMQKDIWSKIPLIQCINLQERPDRLNQVKQEFSRVGILEENINWHRPTKSSKGGVYGCMESHLTCMKKAVSLNAQYSLIFEDDIKFINKDLYSKMRLLFDFINKNKDYDLVMLGWFSTQCDLKTILHNKNKDLIQKQKVLQAHAYVISNKGMRFIIPKLEKLLLNNNNLSNIDVYFMKHFNLNQYTVLHPICIQRKSKSDNKWDYNVQKLTDTLLFEYMQKSPKIKTLIGCI